LPKYALVCWGPPVYVKRGAGVAKPHDAKPVLNGNARSYLSKTKGDHIVD